MEYFYYYYSRIFLFETRKSLQISIIGILIFFKIKLVGSKIII